jgi:hypothetical protein
MSKYHEAIPTKEVSMLLSDIADILLRDKPATLKDEFVRAVEYAIDDWLHSIGKPWLMAQHWGTTDARIRVAMQNENCSDIHQLAKLSDAELLRIPNFGSGSLRRLRELTTGEPYRLPWQRKNKREQNE